VLGCRRGGSATLKLRTSEAAARSQAQRMGVSLKPTNQSQHGSKGKKVGAVRELRENRGVPRREHLPSE